MNRISSFATKSTRLAGLVLISALLLAACAPASVNPPRAPAVQPSLAATQPPTAAAQPSPAATEPAAQPSPEATQPAAPNSVPVTGAAVQAADNARLGKILVDANGMTLYTFAIDTATESKCVDSECVADWPPLIVAAEPQAGSGVPGALATITRADGQKQVTYDGRPLYTFLLDRQPGDTAGDGIDEFGGVWHAVVIEGAAGGANPPASTEAPPAAPAPTEPPSGGGGYKYDY